MDVLVAVARADECPILQNLFELYTYEFSDLVGCDVEENGRFLRRPMTMYWEDEWRRPFLFRVDGKLAGFALIHHRSHISGDTDVWDMAEFFVLRKYRHHGVGGGVATRLFEMHRGAWEVRQLHANKAAIAFWRRAIGDFTRGRFEEVIMNDDRWQGPVQFFVS